MNYGAEQEQEAKILVEQTDRLLAIFASMDDVDVSDVPLRDPANIPWNGRPAAFRLAADAYDKLAAAEKKIKNRVRWERTTEKDGRNGQELMKSLWALLEVYKSIERKTGDAHIQKVEFDNEGGE